MACPKLGCVKWLNGCAVSTRWRMRPTNLRRLQARDLSGHSNTIAAVPRVSRKETETSLLSKPNLFVNKSALCSCTSRQLLYRSTLVMDSPVDVKQEFCNFYPKLLDRIKSSSTFEELPLMRDWIEKVVGYNTLGGKLNRGIALVESYIMFSNNEVSQEELQPALALGWAVELLQAFFLVADDIMDGSLTRRSKPCWYRTNNLGPKAFNDSILLESSVYQIISIYCKQHPSYLPILELFHDVTMRTSLGQAMDLHLAPDRDGKPDLEKFTIEAYDNIARFKTAYYSFYLPVAVAMHLAGFCEEKMLKHAADVLLPMGKFFQVQDDYLDCFGDPEVTGKVGTDIEEGKCSWLVVKALSLCDPSQRRFLEEHYGSSDQETVQTVKNLYTELNLPQLYAQFEEESYQDLITAIEQTEEQALSSILRGFVKKIYKRSN